MSPRNNKFRRTFGVRGQRYGVRYVENGKVKVVWYGDGVRLGRTIVSHTNTAAAREQADGILAEALKDKEPEKPVLTLAGLLAAYRTDAPIRRNPKTSEALRAKTLAGYAEYERAIARSSLDLTMPAAAIRRSNVREWIQAQRTAGRAEGTIARRVDYLKAVYRWAVSEVELLELDPIAGLKSPPRKGKNLPYTEEEGQQLLDAILTMPSRAWRAKLLFLIASAYGVRSLQPLGLTWHDFDLDRVTRVPLPNGRAAQLVGTVTFRKAAPGSKGQPDRTLPLFPIVREAVLEALRHKNGEIVLWSWRDPSKACPYGSMNHQLRKLEKRAKVARVKGRAFHAFRRTLTNALVRKLGVLQASGWIADTPEVLMRTYASATERDTLEAAEYLIRRFIEGADQPNISHSDEPSKPKSLQDNTGAGGFEPPTFRSDQSSRADKTVPPARVKRPRSA